MGMNGSSTGKMDLQNDEDADGGMSSSKGSLNG